MQPSSSPPSEHALIHRTIPQPLIENCPSPLHPLDTFGGVAVCEVENLNGLMRHLTENGYEHHVALTHAACADILQEALQNYMGWAVYRHG